MVSEVPDLIFQMLMYYEAMGLKEAPKRIKHMKPKDCALVPFCRFAGQCCFLCDEFTEQPVKTSVAHPLKNEHVTRSVTSTVF